MGCVNGNADWSGSLYATGWNNFMSENSSRLCQMTHFINHLYSISIFVVKTICFHCYTKLSLNIYKWFNLEANPAIASLLIRALLTAELFSVRTEGADHCDRALSGP